MLNKPFVLIYEHTYLESRTEVVFFRDVNSSLMLQSPNTQTKVELFDLNENVAKQLHLHLDPCKVIQPSYELYST